MAQPAGTGERLLFHPAGAHRGRRHVRAPGGREDPPLAARPRRAPAHRRHVRGRCHSSAHHRPGLRTRHRGPHPADRRVAAHRGHRDPHPDHRRQGLRRQPAALRQRRLLGRHRPDPRHRRDQRPRSPTPRRLRRGDGRRCVLPGGRTVLRAAAALLPAPGHRRGDHPDRCHADARAGGLGAGRRRDRGRLRRHEVPRARRIHPRRHPPRAALRPRLPQAGRPAGRSARGHPGRHPLRHGRLPGLHVRAGRRAARTVRLRRARVSSPRRSCRCAS
ncbi:hypothetical protein SGLAM104S_08128 [Streptomyces glaucescens]